MSKVEARNRKTARRQVRAERRAIALQVTHHLINPALKPAELKSLLAKFAKLMPAKQVAK